MVNSYVTTCTEDENGDLVFDIPEELLDAMGWSEGTELSVEALPGSIILRECAQPEVDGRLLQ
jgi:hypothetical protein